jgi:pyridoxine/pyridoxamine 5'-phosphate oxidase
MDLGMLYSFMARQRYGVVSSVSSEGIPQSALMGIAVTPELEIVFDTVKTSRKYPNLVERAKCSVVVGWEGEQTVQFEGVAVELRGEELQRYQEIYFAVWPEGRERLRWPAIAYFVVRPRWIRYSDYERKPPLVAEISL